MKYSKYTIIVFIISLILFIVPFFWLKPGEMDLGGDSSRLYFYDPISYLHAHVLYNIVSSGIGGNAVSYYSLPFMLLLFGLKLLFSSTIILSLVNGIKISFGFLFCYLIVKELLNAKTHRSKDTIIQISAILSGLFYALSPILTNTGWERSILSHMQVFLNPLFFYLLLKFFLNNSKKYLVSLLLLTFVFSIGFSYAAAPPFFAFYPISIVFIMLYAKYVREKVISLKRLVFGVILFFLLQAFHVVPHLIGIFSLGSDVSASVFSDQTKFSRGLDYFTAIAPNVKVSMGFMALPQIAKLEMLAYANILFPFIIVLGLYLNKTKAILITSLFFLIVLFFAAANITDTGFLFYKSLFYIPGFKMFRNFYGQWAFVFIFFYTILLGQCLAVVLNNARIKYKNVIIAIFSVVVLINSIPLLSGQKINSLHHLSKTSAVFQMDPGYEQVLAFIKNSAIDGKILTLPLTGSGYQVLSGKNGDGAYVGPSTFSYLAAKNDYTGYEGLGPFGDFFVQAIKKRDVSVIKKLFSILNIQYVFYNSDNKIYNEFFPFFPYDYARLYMPNTQEEYKNLLKQLPLDFDKKVDFNSIFHLYPVTNSIFLPHIYTTSEVIYSNKPLELQFDEKINTYPVRSVFLNIENSELKRGDIIINADSDSALNIINDNSHLHRHEPFVSVALDEISYPFIVLKEKFDLWRRRNNHDQYLNFSLLFLSKRIFELDRLREKMPIGQENWEEPYIWEFYKWGSYNAWYSSITRYERGMEQLIDWVNSNSSGSMLSADKIKINEQLNQHKVRLLKSLDNPRNDKEYNTLITLMNKTFDSLDKKLNLEDYNPSVFNYTIVKPNIPEQEYGVFVQKPERDLYDFTNAFIMVGNKKITPISSSLINGFIQFQNVRLSDDNSSTVLFLNPINLVKDFSWDSSGNSKILNDNISLDLNNFVIDGTGGVTKEIPGWRAETQYFITFEYKTFGENFIFKFYDKKINPEKSSRQSGQIYFEKNLDSTVWKKTQSFIHADLDSLAAYLQIIPKTNKKNARMEIKNLSIFEIDYPKIYFQKINSDSVDKSLPEITFTKINPTKYKLDVKNARNSYMLVFQEAFNSNWNLYDVSMRENNLRKNLAYLYGVLAKRVMQTFENDALIENKAILSHFNGEINENKHVNQFITSSTFESWGKRSVAQQNHVLANGYANAWFIEPKSMDNRTSYTLILEMKTQRYFYIFLSISVFTAFVLFLYFLRLLFGNEKND